MNEPFETETPDPEPKKDARGRPSKYDPAKLPDVTNLCLLGLTDDELSEFLGIDRSTFYDWKNKYPEFADAIWSGKQGADALVAESLYKNARTGDTGAAKHWLNNRRRSNWSEKMETKVVIEREQVFKIGDIEIKF